MKLISGLGPSWSVMLSGVRLELRARTMYAKDEVGSEAYKVCFSRFVFFSVKRWLRKRTDCPCRDSCLTGDHDGHRRSRSHQTLKRSRRFATRLQGSK